MRLLGLLVASTVLALCSAKPSLPHTHKLYTQSGAGYFDSEGKYQAGIMQANPAIPEQTGSKVCRSAIHNINDSISSYVHVCEAGRDSSNNQQFCFSTDAPCCILLTTQTPLQRFRLSFGNKGSFAVNFYTSGAEGAQGVCYAFDDDQDDLPPCSSCRRPDCVVTRCIDNIVVDECQPDGYRCVDGYAPPNCCKCDFSGITGQQYFLAADGTCQVLCPFCASQVTVDGCKICQDGYIGPNCCDCKAGYYKAEDDTCKTPCPSGVISCSNNVCTCKAGYTGPNCCQCAPDYYRSTDGTCKSVCPTGVSSCSDGVCTCKTGYAGPDCCLCAPGYYQSSDGTCKEPCLRGIRSCFNGVCTCKDGYTGPDCCLCAPGFSLIGEVCEESCSRGVISCSGGVCTCKPGYTGSDCCMCAPDYYRSTDGTCQEPCLIGVSSCSNGVCTCKTGYTGPDCCKCAPGYYQLFLESADGVCRAACPLGVSSCSDGVCTCAVGYAGIDCCRCAPGYYLDSTDDRCKAPCSSNVVSCTNGVCICQETFGGPDCCDLISCNAEQDIYFLVDATFSNNRLAFCQTHYGVELMIAAINPSSSDTGTRIGGVFYPKINRGGNPVARPFFDLGTSCTQILSDYNEMLDGFYNTEFPDNKFRASVRGEGTYPAATIGKLTETIRRSIQNGESVQRRRIVVVVTDGNNDGELSELQAVVSALDEVAPGVKIIAAGNDDLYAFEPDLAQVFRNELTIIANGNTDNVVIRRNSIELAVSLVEKMRDIQAICPVQANMIINNLETQGNSLAHCHCIDSRGPAAGSTAKRLCGTYCPLFPRDCRAPPTCNSVTALVTPASIEGNLDESAQNSHSDIDEEALRGDILAAIDKVLKERIEE